MIQQIRQVYEWYDGPLVFDFTDESENLFFAYVFDDDRDKKHISYVIQKIKEDDVSSLKNFDSEESRGDIDWQSLNIFGKNSDILVESYDGYVVEFRKINEKEWHELKGFLNERNEK